MKRNLIAIFFVGLLFFNLQVTAQEKAVVPGKQIEMSFKASDGAEVPYLLYLPKDYQADGEKSFGLMLFLHGRGESNGPLSLVAKWGPPRFAARGDELPWIIVSPQCPRSDNWSSDTQQARLTELLDAVVADYKVNPQRIFLTGLSMGGYGSWTMATRHPERFAAVAPVCGGGKPEDAEKLKDIPIWVFHGDQDRAVPFQKSVEMVDAIKAAGGEKVLFTTLENIGHNCWSSAYATPELYQWMERQAKEN
jgi:predicted peptidase